MRTHHEEHEAHGGETGSIIQNFVVFVYFVVRELGG